MADGGWRAATTPAGAAGDPATLDALAPAWLTAAVPGTAASVLRDAGAWPDHERDLDDEDWWWRATLPVPTGIADPVLVLRGLATVADVWVDGVHALHAEHMFRTHRVALGPGSQGREVDVTIRCAALAPRLQERRPRPRWRTAITPAQTIRWYRTALAGRMPGWWDGPPIVGPWRPVELTAERQVLRRRLHAGCGPEGGPGVVDVDVVVSGPPVTGADVIVGTDRATLEVVDHEDGVRVTGTVTVADPPRWWPHTHGPSPTVPVVLELDGEAVPIGRVGFRHLHLDQTDGGFAFTVNGVPLFLRGAVWMPVDPVSLQTTPDALDAALDDLTDAGLNLVRLSGTATYEDDAFHDACDARGVLVWQDVMLANVDTPDDPSLLGQLSDEVEELLDRIAHRPSTVLLCGSSEQQQQAAMLGLPRDRWTTTATVDTIPAVVDARAPWLAYVPSTPTGGPFPFTPDTGITHYYGVGAYRRGIDDVRRSAVRFAAECLAFANPPETLPEPLRHEIGSGEAWKRGVPRDRGADWDFEDVRDHYVAELFAVDVDALRRDDPARYLELGRAAVAHLVHATFSEWGRPASGCGGALVWTLRDLVPGAGWGLVDATGVRKAPWFALRRAAAPVALFVTDEGLNGLHVHLRNDRASDLDGELRVTTHLRGEVRSESASTTLCVPARTTVTTIADTLFDGFRDLTWAYRFGPLEADVIEVELLVRGEPVANVVHLPGGPARPREEDLGLRARFVEGGVEVTTRRFAQAVHLFVPGHEPLDNWFDLAPGGGRRVSMVARDERPDEGRPTVSAVNASASTVIEGSPG